MKQYKSLTETHPLGLWILYRIPELHKVLINTEKNIHWQMIWNQTVDKLRPYSGDLYKIQWNIENKLRK